MKGFWVHFACNGDHGVFLGKVAMASVQIGRNHIDLEREHVGGVRFVELTDGFRIHRATFTVVAAKYWVGNWCWNAYRLSYRDYRRLVRIMAANGWQCTGGLARWGDAYDALASRVGGRWAA